MLRRRKDKVKYTSPIYENEKIVTSDIICESVYQLNTVKKTIKDEEGNEITVDATQVSVNINKLF
jgi:hypothetical protein